MSTESLRSVVADALANALTSHGDGRMITRHIVVFESMLENGERVMSVLGSDDLRSWDMLALAGWATTCANTAIANELTRGSDSD